MTERRHGVARTAWLLTLCLAGAGCAWTGSCSSTGGGGIGGVSVAVPVGGGSSAGASGLAIDFHSEPDPPKSGSNAFEVVVKQPDGSPVADATVKVVFSMPAMPSMNMPGMRSEATLAHQSDGRYRGTSELEMAGTWNVAVTVSRGTEEIGSRNLSIVAK